MLTLRPEEARGKANFGWLDSRHSFSFGNYYDPAHMGFKDLRVINEDRVEPGAGFGAHAHQNMEILTYVISGALAHKDSLGNASVIRPGEIQRMSAGAGIRHSEYNASETEPVHFLQIWVLPERPGLAPGYEQAAIPDGPGLVRLAGPGGAVTVHQDMTLELGRLAAGESASLSLKPGRAGWLQLVKGELIAGGEPLRAGDGLAVEAMKQLEVEAPADAEFLWFDLVA